MTNHNVDDWDSYARLVLSELARHNDLLLKINEKLDTIKLQQALYEQEIKQVASDVLDHDADIKELKKRVYKLEQGELLDATIAKYKKYLWTAAFAVVTAIILPIVQIVIRIFF